MKTYQMLITRHGDKMYTLLIYAPGLDAAQGRAKRYLEEVKGYETIQGFKFEMSEIDPATILHAKEPKKKAAKRKNR